MYTEDALFSRPIDEGTSRSLLVMRHAKSSWSDAGLADHDRSLSKRGKRDARRMGVELGDRGMMPDLIVCSTAKRAVSTVRRMTKAADYAGEVVYDDRLYADGCDAHLALLASLPDWAQCVMLVGHNPSSEELVLALTGQSVRLATATVASIELRVMSWSSLSMGIRGIVRAVLSPRDLR